MRICCNLLPYLFIFITTGLVVPVSRSRRSDFDFRGSDRCKTKPCHNPVPHQESSGHDKNEREKNSKEHQEDKVETKCVAKICKGSKPCQSMVKKAKKCALKYCNSGKCSARKAKQPNNEKKEENEEEKKVQERHRNHYNRFTRVVRKYSYKGRRSRETRSTRFNRCVLDRLKKCRKCRAQRRNKRDGPVCDQLNCDKVLGKGPMGSCTHYSRVVDFWKRRVEEEQIQRRYLKYNKLTVKDSDGTERGRLTYNVLEDRKGRPYLYIIHVNASKKGGGAGRALMEHVMEKIAIEKHHLGVSYRKKKMGYVKLELLNGTGNVLAHNLYKNLGFSFDAGQCESDSCPSMTLDLRNYQSGDRYWEKPKLDECVWKNKKRCEIS
ncbi:hypothetical protein DdX_17376 [Ditylenchus destructor]|uniref:N-acetyltransferase domain-containing protein n=1 Tax=Ditylenchus destructor TaxID=166010 RepID=A0AAD4MNR4_9BILA|nr:hypothetical protein DdX_17376 [Ditylenchus destructor]